MGKVKIAQPVPQLPVQDVEKAQIYYKDKLGFEISWTNPDKYMGAVERGDVAIFFAKVNSSIEPNIHWIFSDKVFHQFLNGSSYSRRFAFNNRFTPTYNSFICCYF